MIESYITISKEEYTNLLSEAALLSALFAVGVDNWEGYEEANLIVQQEDLEPLILIDE